MTLGDESIRIWGIVPAAGLSRRMGTIKQTLLYRESTMVASVARTMLSGDADGVIVVTRTELKDALHLPEDSRIAVVFNDDANSQMIDSIRLGLTHIVDAGACAAGPRDGILIIPGDMPTVGAEACRCCIDAYKSSPDRVVIATHRGHRGHPMIFPLVHRQELAVLTGGLNELPRRHGDRVVEVAVDDPGVLRDVDTSEDYRSLES